METGKGPEGKDLLAVVDSLSNLIHEKLSDLQGPTKKRKTSTGDQSDIEELSKLVDEKLRILKEHAQLLEQQRSKEKQAEKKVENVIQAQESEIKLNVGGTLFQVSRATLLKDPDSMFALMFSGRFPLVKGEDGAYFIDRDPTYFRHIINFLRGHKEELLAEPEAVRLEILKEADYYQISELISLLQGASRMEREKQLGPENVKMRDEENAVRKLLIDQNTDVSKTPYIHLIDVFKEQNTFQFPKDISEIPKIPTIMDSRRSLGKGSSICASLKSFKTAFEKMVPCLKGLNWNNLFAAGGAVLSALIGGADFASSDVDLFLWGLDEDGALAKIHELYDTISKNNGGECAVVRTSRTLTFLGSMNNKHVQIVLRLYRIPAEVLLGFDLDCVCVGYDGERVWALPRARRAINWRLNIADPTRQTFRTTSYEYRLWKYSKRGFGVAIPGFSRDLVNNEIYNKTFDKLQGLARLLFLEARDAQRGLDMGGLEYWGDKHGYPRKKVDPEALDTHIVGHVIDYNEGLLLPFPKFQTQYATLQLLEYRVVGSYVNDQKRRAGKKIPVNYIFGESLEDILDADEFETFDRNHYEITVPKTIRFIGSFKEYIQSLPDVEDDWYRDAMKQYTPQLERV